MDLTNFTTTSTLAIEAVYSYFWDFIPKKYKIFKDDTMFQQMTPFYDPELNFENRFHYKLTNVDYPKRANPWFIITWNTENGILKSELSQRRFSSAKVVTEEHGPVQFKFMMVDLLVNLCITGNTMQGLFEIQENIMLKMRNKITTLTKEHPILGEFPICFQVIDSNQGKMEKDKGTLCYLMLSCRIDYPIIGEVKEAKVIQTIHNGVDFDYGSDSNKPPKLMDTIAALTNTSQESTN